MSLTMHSASAPVFTRMFGNLLTWLDKAEAHAAARKFDAGNYLGLRLAPDMQALAASLAIWIWRVKGSMSGARRRPR